MLNETNGDAEDTSVISQKDDQNTKTKRPPSSGGPLVDRNISYIEQAPTMQSQLISQLSGESPRLGGSSLNVLEFSEFSKKEKPEENGIKDTELQNANNSNNLNNNISKMGESINCHFHLVLIFL